MAFNKKEYAKQWRLKNYEKRIKWEREWRKKDHVKKYIQATHAWYPVVKEIFKVTNTININELNSYINNIKFKAGLENNFSKLGINIKKALPKILSGVNNQRLSNNRIKITKKDIKNILLRK